MQGEDRRHVELLGVFHYALAALAALAGTCPVLHLIMGLVLLFGGFESAEGEAPPAWFGALFVVVAGVLILAGWVLAVLAWLAGRRLRGFRAYRLCFGVAVAECLFVPFGTLLGVLTLVVLSRPAVKAGFGVPDGGPVRDAETREG